MQKYDLNSLNEEQTKALLKTEGAVLVTAGAGSGKTNLLTHRIAYLIKEKQVSPYNILAITFTNKAAQEMRDRISQMVYCDGLWISTFHSMCAKILRFDIDKIGYNKSFTIYSESDSDKVLDQILANEVEKKELKKQLKFLISDYKNKNFFLEDYADSLKELDDCEKLIGFMRDYEETLKANNALDFDDLLTKTLLLFRSCPDVLKKYQERFRYVLVDEFQDTNFTQYLIVKALCDYYKNIFVVGDEDQCIYSWRGASYLNMNRFQKDFEDVSVFKLETNYRSTPNILKLANNVIANNKTRIDKVLKAVRAEEKEPEFYEAFDEEAEARYVVGKILFLMQNYNVKLKDIAILMRVNAISLPIEQALLSYNLPYRIYGGFKFFERAEIKNVLSYMRLFVNPEDEIALLRIINFPKRGIGEGAVSKIKELAKNENKTMLEIISNYENYSLPNALKTKLSAFADSYKKLLSEYEITPLDEFISRVIEEFNIKSAYDRKTEEEENKILNIDMLVGNVKEFVSKNEGALLADYLESVTLISDIDNMDESNTITVATIHAVKGLEFDVVFVIGAEEKIFPISRAYDSIEDMEEERRLMYVAITRAKSRLFMSYCNSRYLYGHRDYTRPSRFLKEGGYAPKLKSPVSETSVFSNFSGSQFNGFDKNSFFSSSNLNTASDKDISMYSVGQKVCHTKYGIGEIIDIVDNGKCAEIKFEGFGVKTLVLEIAPIEIVE